MKLVSLTNKEQEILKKVDSNKDKIIDILNKIAYLEFMTNYDLGEYARVVDKNHLNENSKYLKLKGALENILDDILKGTEFKYRIMNFGTLSINHPITELESEVPCSQDVLNYHHTLNLPYTYVMGKKVGKRYASTWLQMFPIDIKNI